MKHVTYITDFAPESFERVLVSIDEHDGTYFADKYPEGCFSATVYTVSKFGNLFYNGQLATGKTFGSCMGAAKRRFKGYFGQDVQLGDVVLDGKLLASPNGKPSFFCDINDESVHDNFRQWAASLFE